MNLVVLAALALGALQTDAALAPRTEWQASWIGMQEEADRNTWLCFRKEINLDEAPEEAVARIACDSKYWLWINGNMAVFEGQIKRGPTPDGTYFDQVDLASHLEQGKNTIALLVWHWGKHGFSHNNSGKAGLLFEADIDGQMVASGDDWRVRQHPAYKQSDEPLPNYRLPEANIVYDAREALGDWQAQDFDDADWANAATFGQAPAEPWGPLYERPIPQWKVGDLQEYADVREEKQEDGSRVFVAELPYNAHVTPYLAVDGPAGKPIDIRTDTYVVTGNNTLRAVYITKEGSQRYESLGWLSGHEVRYTVPEGVEVEELRYRETGYDADFAGRFESSDKALNQLWEEAKRTLYVTMRDTYMDCPDRERAQWWGDEVNELGEAFYVLDPERGPLLARKGVLELARWQRPDDVLYSPVPAGLPEDPSSTENPQDGSWYRELPRQMLASVGWYGFWTYYYYTADEATIEVAYPHVRDYLALWELGEDGLAIHRPGDWDWTDWGGNKDVPVIENAWVYLALKAAVEMAELTGNEGDVAGYEQKMESIAANFNETFWQGEHYMSPGHDGPPDDRAQAMAVVSGLAKPEYYDAIAKVLDEQQHASPYMEKYVLEALFMMHENALAVERMKRRYESMLNDGITTLWETFGTEEGREGEQQGGSGTYNHAWSGGPLTIMSQYMAGVAPTEPAFARFHVLPQMGPVQRIETLVPAPQGDIEVELQQAEGSFSMALTVPEETEAVAGVPLQQGQPREVKINGSTAWREGEAVANDTAAAFEAADEHWLRFNLPPGEYTIEASW